MVFHLNLSKAIQAAGVLLKDAPGRSMDRIRLIKLLYIAERESFREFGEPITGDRIVAMEHGPVLSCVYNCIKGEGPRRSCVQWDAFFVSRGNTVEMQKNPEDGDLSDREIATLKRVAHERRDKIQWEIVDETHHFQEWIDHNPGKSSRPIPFEDILAAVGRDVGSDLKEAKEWAEWHSVLEG
jgi:uncharacterized phage-associated protein